MSMLTEKEQQNINEELKLFPAKRYAVIEAISVVQKERGWISDGERHCRVPRGCTRGRVIEPR